MSNGRSTYMDKAWLDEVKRIPGPAMQRARVVALACRLDRRLQEAGEAASRPEMGLVEALRQRLRWAVADDGAGGGPGPADVPASTGPAVDGLAETVAAIHQQLDFLPRPGVPLGLRVFFRELFGEEWDARVVISPTARLSWPKTDGIAGSRVGPKTDGIAGSGVGPKADGIRAPGAAGRYPLAVIPQAELDNPLMWPMIGWQVAAHDGWEHVVADLARRLGPAMTFAQAEGLAAVDGRRAQQMWEAALAELDGWDLTVASELASALADGVLISAYRRGRAGAAAQGAPRAQEEGAAGAEFVRDGGGIYARLAATYDEPAQAADILLAGWLHWYGGAMERLLTGHGRGAEGWDDMCRLVHGMDDLLRRSLDVAAIHRFYASGGQRHDFK